MSFSCEPLISIIVPVYKTEAYICECLDSIRNQSYTNIEIILVDDGSPDRCPSICDNYVAKDRRFFVIHKKNEGSWKARVTGIQHSHGEFLAFVDSDDFIHVDYIKKLYTAINENMADIASCNAIKVYNSKNIKLSEYPGENENKAIESILTGKLDGYSWLKLVRADVLKNNTFSELNSISLWEDIAFSIELYFFSKKICYIPEFLYFYRYNTSSLCNFFSEKSVTDLIQVVNIVENFLRSKSVLSDFNEALCRLKARAKTLILVQASKCERKKHISLFSEADKYIYSTRSIPIYNRLEALFFLHHLSILGIFLNKILSIARGFRK